MRIALVRSSLRYFYLILGIVAFCTVLPLGMLGIVWVVLGDEPARASRWMSALVGQEVQIDGIEVSWQGFGPKLRFSQVRIMDPETKQPLLSFREAYLGAALSRAKAAGEKTPRRRLIVVGGRLAVERKAEGCIRIHGLQDREASCSDSDFSHFPAWLFKFTRLTLQDVEIDWIDPVLDSVPLHLNLTALHLFNESDRYHLEGAATLPKGFGKAVAIRAEFGGHGFDDPKSYGILHFEGEGVQFERWQERSLFSELHFAGGTGNFELEIQWGKTAAPEIVAKFAWKNGVIAGNAGQVPIQQVSGTARYQSRENGWSVEVPRLFVVGDKGAWPMTALQLEFHRGSIPSLQGEFEFLRLQDIAALFQLSNRIDSKLRRFLKEARPVGELRNLKFSLPLSEEYTTQWKLSATGTKFGFRPWRRWPGTQGLVFALQLTGKEGQLNINSREARLLSVSLENPVKLDTFQGKITWWQGRKGWQILANNIRLENQELAMAAALHFRDLPRAGIPHLDLILTLERMELAALSRYLSLYTSNSNFIQWLGQAFSAGRAVGGGLVFQGPWRNFPFPGNGGRFAVDVGIRKATLNYASGWPPLEAVDAYLYSNGQILTARAIRGRVFNSQVTGAVARISDLRAQSPSLMVRGQAQGDAEDGWRFVQQSPLQKRYGGFLQGVELGGDARLDLNLKMLLGNKKEPPLVAGELTFAEANLRQRHSPFLVFTDIKGNLYFTHAGVKAKGLAARFLEQPVVVDLQSRAEEEGEIMTQLSIRGPMKVPLLAERWFPFLSPWLGGSTNFTAEAIFQKGPKNRVKLTTVQVNSDLKGVQITLPPPFAKPASRAQKLAAEIRRMETEKWQIRGAYKKELYGLFEIEKGKQPLSRLRGELRVGNHAVELPEHGIRVVGTLPEISLSAWQKVFNSSRPLSNLGGRIPLEHIALHIGRLEIGGQHFEEVAVEANPTSSFLWRAQVVAPAVRGSIAIPVAGAVRPVDIDLEYLHWDPPSAEGSISSLTNPRGWPTFHLQCRQFRYNGYDLGAIQAWISGRANGVHLERLEVISPTLRIRGQGDWVAHGKTQWSHLDLKADSPDLGQLLADFGYPTNLVGGKARVEVVAGWPGSPSGGFDLKQVAGNMQLEMGKGRLLNIEPGAGRLFGLLSISALPRRLALDFSDLFSKGLTFDRIKGDFSFHKGDASSNELVMEGPAARIQARGRIGLADQDYDQIVAVTPNVFSSLPLAGIIAWGPVGLGVGTALMLADRFVDMIFGVPVGQLITYHYKISGSWAKPVVARIRKFLPSKQ